jgi:hypothetical protein
LFAIALAVQWVCVPGERRLLVIGRIFVAAVAAACVIPLARDVQSLNVLFTLAWGLVLSALWNSSSRWKFVASIPILLASFACEYGVWGLLAVYFFCEFAVQQRGRRAWACLSIAIGLICIANSNWYAAGSVPLVWVIARSGLGVPRVRRFFHFGYVLQWPVFAAAKAAL